MFRATLLARARQVVSESIHNKNDMIVMHFIDVAAGCDKFEKVHRRLRTSLARTGALRIMIQDYPKFAGMVEESSSSPLGARYGVRTRFARAT